VPKAHIYPTKNEFRLVGPDLEKPVRSFKTQKVYALLEPRAPIHISPNQKKNTLRYFEYKKLLLKQKKYQ